MQTRYCNPIIYTYFFRRNQRVNSMLMLTSTAPLCLRAGTEIWLARDLGNATANHEVQLSIG